MLAGFQELCCFGKGFLWWTSLVSIGLQQVDYCHVRRIQNPSIFMNQADLVDSNLGRITQVCRTGAGMKPGWVSHPHRGKVAAEVAIWFEGCVSLKFGKISQHMNRVSSVLDSKIWGINLGFWSWIESVGVFSQVRDRLCMQFELIG